MRRLFATLALASACASAPPPAPRESDDSLARAAVATFLACYERDGAECRSERAPVKEWTALSALALVRDGIPTELVTELPKALGALRNDAGVKREFIRTLTDHEGWVRTAGCSAADVEAIGPRVLAIADAAHKRIDRLGLGDTESGGNVQQLAQAAKAIGDARLVGTSCARGRRPLYFVVARVDGTWVPVALYDEKPPWLAPAAKGDPPAERVRLPWEGQNRVDPWIPVYEEEL